MNGHDLAMMLKQLPSHAVLDLLPRFGYQIREEIAGRGVVFESPSGEQIAVPTNKEFRDYGRAILEVLDLLQEPGVTLSDLIAMLALPDCDIYRHRFADESAKWGSFPLYSFSEALPALHDLLKYTAAGAASQRRSYIRIPEIAERFERGCQAGQTEHGSYVVKIFCPTNPTAQFADSEGEPFGRTVTKACLENLAFLLDEEADVYDASLPATFNKNVAQAIGRLRPLTFMPQAVASFWFSARYSNRTAQDTVNINETTFKRASLIERRLTSTTGISQASYRGFIVELHKDRPGQRRLVSHTITLEIRDGNAWRKLHLSLLPDQYRNAVKWHDRNQAVRLTALIDKRTKPWSVTEIISLESVDKNQAELFPDDTSRP